MATVTVAQQKLVMNAFAAVLQSELVSAEAVTWKEHDGEMDDRGMVEGEIWHGDKLIPGTICAHGPT